MKKTQEILGLPIISISDAMEKGKVKGVIVNAERGAVDYIIVDSGFQVIGMRVISMENVLGIGEYALTIEDEKSIIDIGSVPQAVELLQKDVQVKDTRVMTKKGRLVGETGDYFVDEDEYGIIAGLEFVSENTKNKVIPRKHVITFGKNLIVVTEDFETSLIDDISNLDTGEEIPAFEKKNPIVEEIKAVEETVPEPIIEIPQFSQEAEPQPEELAEEIPELIDDGVELGENVGESLDALTESETEIVIEPASLEIVPETVNEFTMTESEEVELESDSKNLPEDGAAGLFEQRQRQYLKGRRATKTITDSSGGILVNEGTVITDEVIDTVKANGKMIELVMNNKA